MKSETTQQFWDSFRLLPPEIRKQAYEAHHQFQRDPFASGLHFKEVNKKRRLWSARITRDYRVIGVRAGETITWVWIGPHAEYDKRIKGR